MEIGVGQLADQIRLKVDTHELPRDFPPKVWAGHGNEHACQACMQPIVPEQVSYEFDAGDHRTYCFHAGCFDLWQAELRRRGWLLQ
jgi:hypothetical protein